MLFTLEYKFSYAVHINSSNKQTKQNSKRKERKKEKRNENGVGEKFSVCRHDAPSFLGLWAIEQI